jgi:hypothetical protein
MFAKIGTPGVDGTRPESEARRVARVRKRLEKTLIYKESVPKNSTAKHITFLPSPFLPI